MPIVEDVNSFIKQCVRVVEVTHKPKQQEFNHIALSTGLGMVVIGIIGFIIAMASHYLRGF